MSFEGYWNNEPDLEALRKAYDLLPVNRELALKNLQGLAERGSLMSMIYLAEAIESDPKATNDVGSASDWYSLAAQKGAPLANYRLGRRALNERDFSKARSFFEVAVAKNYMPAAHQLAKLLYEGCGGPRDTERARTLLENASEAGYVFAKRDLARILIGGGFGWMQIARGFLLFGSAIILVPIVLATDPTRERLR